MNSYVSSIYKKENDIFGYPQEYKGIKFYPIKVEEVELKELFYKLFFQPKNYIPDRDILRASYLKFLLYVVQSSIKANNSNENLSLELLYFLSKITRLENFEYEESSNPDGENVFDKISLRISINREIFFDENDFDNIREIILEQNGSSIEYVEGYNPDLEKKLAFMNKGTQDVDLKDEVFSFCAITKMPVQEVGQQTLYQFKARLEREMIMKDYYLFKPLEVSKQISSKSGEELFKHYLSHIPKNGRYSSILIDKDKFMENSGLGSANSDGNINA